MKKRYVFIFLITLLLFFPKKTYAIINQIIDNNINTNLNNDYLLEIFKNFEDKYNIIPYVFITDKSNQDLLNETIEKYNENNKNDFILFFISLNDKNVAIYTSASLDDKITKSDKYVMLTSIQTQFKNNDINKMIEVSINNLDKLLELKNNNISDKNNQSVQVNKNPTIYLILMIVSFIFFIFPFFIFFYKKFTKK